MHALIGTNLEYHSAAQPKDRPVDVAGRRCVASGCPTANAPNPSWSSLPFSFRSAALRSQRKQVGVCHPCVQPRKVSRASAHPRIPHLDLGSYLFDPLAHNEGGRLNLWVIRLRNKAADAFAFQAPLQCKALPQMSCALMALCAIACGHARHACASSAHSFARAGDQGQTTPALGLHPPECREAMVVETK